VPLASIHNDPANARAHDEANLGAITASLQRFGQAEPLVVHKPTGRVIGGNGRLVAMRKLGWIEVDVVELDVTDLDATALGIALNRTAELAEWDEPALAQLLKSLRAEDALNGVGFSEVDLDELIASVEGELANSAEIVEDEPPAPGHAAITMPWGALRRCHSTIPSPVVPCSTRWPQGTTPGATWRPSSKT